MSKSQGLKGLKIFSTWCIFDIIVPFAVILALSAFLGFIASILVLGLLSIVLRIIVDTYGDRMLTDAEVYMNSDQIEEFGKKELDLSTFK